MTQWPKKWTLPFFQPPQTESNKEQVQNPQREIRLTSLQNQNKLRRRLPAINRNGNIILWWRILVLFCQRLELWRAIIWEWIWYCCLKEGAGGTAKQGSSHTTKHCHRKRSAGLIDWPIAYTDLNNCILNMRGQRLSTWTWLCKGWLWGENLTLKGFPIKKNYFLP